jgi:hypothetical protein
MPAFMDLTGKRFGYLVVQSIQTPKAGPHHRWLCICDCGNTVVVLGPSLREGRTKSCGCFHIEQISKHGGLNSPEYSSWTAMKNRCLNQNHASYHRYGGRGIYEGKIGRQGNWPTISESNWNFSKVASREATPYRSALIIHFRLDVVPGVAGSLKTTRKRSQR